MIYEEWFLNSNTAATPVAESVLFNKSLSKILTIVFIIIILAAAGSPVTEPGIKTPFKNRTSSINNKTSVQNYLTGSFNFIVDDYIVYGLK